MGISSVNLVVLFVWVCLLSHVKYGEAIDEYKYTVHITNNLGNSNQLTTHCYTNGSDLGVHVLSTSQEFQWSVHRGFWVPKAYWCDMTAENRSKTVQVYIEVKAFTDMCADKGLGECFWSVRDDGFYMMDDVHGNWKLIVDWNS
ncbi:hypothetical protein like AT4G24974 [Hibiscus trionum]|uniref:S-protein homolog n=1 Tax=Hibiscus trionum TaxID=183268 RepID=A0A9W7MLL8_HIBTR|nr:hypothetical protein like AT4G24974 [Hibiscus trionum]